MKNFWNKCKQTLVSALILVIVAVTPAQAAPQVPNTSEKDLLKLYQERLQYPSWWRAGCDNSAILPWVDLDNGDTVEEVIQNITDSPFEIHVVFDREGEKVMDGTNRMRDVVSWDPKHRPTPESTNIHVHPASDDGFSAGDLYAGATRNDTEEIIVTWDFIFSLKPGENGWPDPSSLKAYHQKQLDEASKMESFTFEPKWAETMTAMEHNGLSWAARQTGGGFLYTHYAAIKTAEHFGLKYEVLPRRETDEIDRHKGYVLKRVTYTNPLVERKQNHVHYEYSAK